MAQEKKSQIAKDILRRVRWLYFFFLLIAFAIIGRVVWIQYGPQGAELRAKSRKITFERVAIEAERGDILARDGRILATSVPTYEIRMDFAAGGLTDSIFNNNVDSLAYCLSAFFKDRSQASYKKMLTDARADKAKNRYKLISPYRVDYLQEKQIREFPVFRLGKNKGGYIREQVNRRLTPHGSLAGRSIGMTNQSGVKLGIEGAFDEDLRGKDGSAIKQRVSGSFKIDVPDASNVEPVNGMDVVTTIDVDLQDVAETALRNQLETMEADWGTVVLMEVATGEIHAMANLTRKSPGVCVEDFNYAIGRRIEPGSTFKLATLITLLDDAKMSLDDMIDCENGYARVGKTNVPDDHKEGIISLRRVFEVSSNIGFAKSVHKNYSDNPARYVDFIRKMGFRDPLKMQIPGEADPFIKHPSEKGWDGTTLVRMAYGYAFEITPMHTLALYNAIANDGRMMRPKLVKEIRNYGQTVKTFPNETINSEICSKNTLKLVRESLEGVVDEGTGGVLKNPYYSVAAKTGTAQVALNNGGYRDSRGGMNYLATMVGYFPADNPKYTCIVAIKTYYGPGRYKTYYGAPVSGPVFRAIADRVYAANPSWHEEVDNSGSKQIPDDRQVKNGNGSHLRNIAAKLSLPFKVDRSAPDWVAINRETVEPPESPAGDENAEVKPKTIVSELEYEPDEVPNVIGMGLRDAIYLLESRGLIVSFTGRGRITSQSVAAGTKVTRGQSINLKMSP